ncbi:acetolactate decarboxylase [Telluribacter sp.]|uniref:acetolactate decarboxylase n=1 Tax=Telluribacter sp. TaxID=1978767 RepID=UPI002E0F5185|nr:acetolactate decarboxylase [Telluribacter sp.]
MKNLCAYCCLVGLYYVLLGCTSLSKEAPHQQDEVLYQVSTIDALLSGDYDGTVTCGELRQHGDFGIGTFNGLDGEMLQLDGEIFKIRSDGKAYAVPDSTRTPFASVTHFSADTVIELSGRLSYEQLCAYIDSLVPTENIFYAIKVEGEFAYVKARSVPRQSKPYLPLVEVVKTQPTFEFEHETGTLLGFRTPPYMKGLNVPGYHLHFLTSDHARGGHVMACTLGKVKLSIDYTSAFHMVLPATGTFQRVDLTQDKQEELEKVEK